MFNVPNLKFLQDDLEEGEVKDASPKPETTRQVCRFYGRGQCFYGNACRFLHLNHNEKGQYNMFAPRYSQGYGYGPSNLMGPSNPMMNERAGPVSKKYSSGLLCFSYFNYDYMNVTLILADGLHGCCSASSSFTDGTISSGNCMGKRIEGS